VSIFPGDGQDAESLIRNADAAMYQAKKNGRHRFEFYRPGP
jgi:GGDEF domain-containing protein